MQGIVRWSSKPVGHDGWEDLLYNKALKYTQVEKLVGLYGYGKDLTISGLTQQDLSKFPATSLECVLENIHHVRVLTWHHQECAVAHYDDVGTCVILPEHLKRQWRAHYLARMMYHLQERMTDQEALLQASDLLAPVEYVKDELLKYKDWKGETTAVMLRMLAMQFGIPLSDFYKHLIKHKLIEDTADVYKIAGLEGKERVVSNRLARMCYIAYITGAMRFQDVAEILGKDIEETEDYFNDQGFIVELIGRN